MLGTTTVMAGRGFASHHSDHTLLVVCGPMSAEGGGGVRETTLREFQ